jgi:hypothetical protein
MSHQARIARQSVDIPKDVGPDGWQMVHNPQTFIVLWDEVDPCYPLQDGSIISSTHAHPVARTPRRKKAPA